MIKNTNIVAVIFINDDNELVISTYNDLNSP